MLANKGKMREDPQARGNPLCRVSKCFYGEQIKYPEARFNPSCRVSKCSRAYGEEITFPVFVPRKDWAKVLKGPKALNEDDACAVVRPARSSALAREAEIVDQYRGLLRSFFFVVIGLIPATRKGVSECLITFVDKSNPDGSFVLNTRMPSGSVSNMLSSSRMQFARAKSS